MRSLRERMMSQKHPYRMALIVMSVVFSTVEYVVDTEHSAPTLIVVSFQLALMLGSYWYPIRCACGVLILTVTETVVPGVTFPSLLWTMWLAIGLSAYEGAIVPSVALIVVDAACRVFEIVCLGNLHWNSGSIVTLTCIHVTVCLTGLTLRGHRYKAQLMAERFERRRAEEERLRMQRNLRIASDLHDSTARGLTATILGLDAIIDDEDRSDQADALAGVRNVAKETLAEVRTIIDVLEHRDEPDRSPCKGSLADAIARATHDDERLLSIAGMTGICDIAGGDNLPADAVPAAVMKEIIGLTRQIHTNILSYGSTSKDSYYLRFSITNGRIDIIQCNEIRGGCVPDHRGHGLALHRKRISELGGTLNTSTEDGVWHLRATIPLALRRREDGAVSSLG